jgi:hypothetical protein
VTNDISYVFDKLNSSTKDQSTRIGSCTGTHAGYGTAIRWDGETAFFVSLNETDYRAARTKLCSL